MIVRQAKVLHKFCPFRPSIPYGPGTVSTPYSRFRPYPVGRREGTGSERDRREAARVVIHSLHSCLPLTRGAAGRPSAATRSLSSFFLFVWPKDRVAPLRGSRLRRVCNGWATRPTRGHFVPPPMPFALRVAHSLPTRPIPNPSHIISFSYLRPSIVIPKEK